MSQQPELSGRDETLAVRLYTGMNRATTIPQMFFADFHYSVGKQSFLEQVLETFGDALREPCPEHRALMEAGEVQAERDILVATRMRDVQRDALTR